MPTDPKAWEKITPERLIPAVKHIRESSKTAAWKCSELTEKLCYAALHPTTNDRNALEHYSAAFVTYAQVIGLRACKDFDLLLRAATPPSIFKAFLDVYRTGLEVDTRTQFDQLLRIGIANTDTLKMHPVEWAKSHLQLLISRQTPLVQQWIKSVCDKRDYLKVESTNDFEEIVFWKAWRAPKLIHMQPSGNAPYDDESAWTREDGPQTQHLLAALSGIFVQFLGFELDKYAGTAHVKFAESKECMQASQSETERSYQPLRPISRAPRPPTVLGNSWVPPEPKPTQSPLNWPPFFPNCLRLQTTVVICEALSKFPVQTQALEMSKYVISELTPHFCDAVHTEAIRADLALSQMSALIESLLRCNCEDSSETLRLEQETRKSQEWRMLAVKLSQSATDLGTNCSINHQVPSNRSINQQVPCAITSNVDGTETWDGIVISFLSDERVQIRCGEKIETRNYAEFGFADRRSGKPNQAWVTMRALAKQGGLIRDAVGAGRPWPKVEKRIQEIRKVLREHFGLSADPIPFIAGVGYQTCFTIGCERSFDT